MNVILYLKTKNSIADIFFLFKMLIGVEENFGIFNLTKQYNLEILFEKI